MNTSIVRVAFLYLAESGQVWLPDYLGSGVSVVGAALRLIKQVSAEKSSQTKSRHPVTPKAIAGGLFFHMLKDSADLGDDATHIRPILDRNMGLEAGGDMWRHAGLVYNSLMHDRPPSNKGLKALRIAMLGVELLQRTGQSSKAQAINAYFVRKYADDLPLLQPGRDKELLPADILHAHIDAEMKREAKRVAVRIGKNPQKALAFIQSVLAEVNFHSLVQKIPGVGPIEPLSEAEEEAAVDIAGFLQDNNELAASFGLALLEAVGATALAKKYETVALQVGKQKDLFVNRFAVNAYTGNPDGLSIYPNEIDHGYGEPIAGGTDVMQKLQNQFRHEQGRDQRPESPRIASNKSDGAIGTSLSKVKLR